MANEDRGYVRWLSLRPCAIPDCPFGFVAQVHHPRHDVAMGKRAHDHRAVPLCYEHHEQAQTYRLLGMPREQLRTWLDQVAEKNRKLYLEQEDTTMRVKGPIGERPEEMPVLDLNDEAKEMLASMPGVPVCVKCKKKSAEVNDDGFCNICQPPLPKVRMEAASMVKRPSLEVEREVHDNLMPRLQAHVGRMCSWDLRKLSPERRVAFSGAILDLSAAFARVSAELTMLDSEGFVAKTTEATRMSSKLPIGSKVRLRGGMVKDLFRAVYSEEQLNSLAVSKKTDTHVLLIASDGTNIGLVKFCHLDLEEKKTP